MTPIQEIRIRMVNGDLADASLVDHGGSWIGTYEYVQHDGVRLDPSNTMPTASALLAFEALVQAVSVIASARRSTIDEVDNTNNTELLSETAERSVMARMGVTAPVLVNGA